MSLFHASQQMATISSYELKMRFDNQLSRMNCHIFSTGLSSRVLGGNGMIVMLFSFQAHGRIKQPGNSSTVFLPIYV